jgi:hypothetical protein
MVLPPSEHAVSEVVDVTMVDRKLSRRCDLQVQVPQELCHEDRPRPKRHNNFETDPCAAVVSFSSMNEGSKSWRSSQISYEFTEL